MAGAQDRTAARAAVKLTYDDFVHFPDDRKRHELIDGEHYVTAAPNIAHQRILGSLYLLIGNWLEEHPIGMAFMAPLDVVFSDFDVVEPDFLFLTKQRAAETLTPAHVRGVPELIVEIASKSTRKRDETIKRRLYERMGVSEYWIIDPETEVVRVSRREGTKLSRPLEFSRDASDVLTTPLLPGLNLPLTRIFRE